MHRDGTGRSTRSDAQRRSSVGRTERAQLEPPPKLGNHAGPRTRGRGEAEDLMTRLRLLGCLGGAVAIQLAFVACSSSSKPPGDVGSPDAGGDVSMGTVDAAGIPMDSGMHDAEGGATSTVTGIDGAPEDAANDTSGQNDSGDAGVCSAEAVAKDDPRGGSDCQGLQGLPCCLPTGDCVGDTVPPSSTPSGVCNCILPDGGHEEFGQPDPVGMGTWTCHSP